MEDCNVTVQTEKSCLRRLSGFSCQDSPEYHREKDHGCLENLGERMEEVGIEDGIEGVHPSQWVNLN